LTDFHGPPGSCWQFEVQLQTNWNKKEQIMTDKKPEEVYPVSSQTLTDDQIVTERKLPRRSFLTAAGTFVAGAAAIVAGTRATAVLASPQNDPDKKKASDPDKKKASDPDKKKRSAPPK
jgi:hypothetical protein